MKRNVIVNKLIAEGFSEKTLVKFTDSQLSDLAERMLGEASVQTIPTTVFKMTDPKDATQVNNMLNNPNAMKAQQQKGQIKVQAAESKGINPSAAKRKDQVAQGAYDGRFKTKTVPDKKKEASKNWAKQKTEKDLSEEKPSAGLSKEKKSEVVKKAKKGGDIGKKGKGFEKLANKASKKYGSKEAGQKVAAAAMWKNLKEGSSEIKNWVNMLAEENFHSFTSKNEIMELIQLKLNESEVAHQSKLPEFMTYDSIKSSGPAVAPTKPKTSPGTKPGTSPGKPKPRTPYEPGIGPKHKPKAYGLKEDEIMELDHDELKNSPRFEEFRNALAKNINVSVAYVKNDGTVRHMLVKRNLSSYVPSDKEKTEKQLNINQNHDVKRVIDLNAYNKSLRETGDKELSAKKAWRTINLDNVLGFMVRGNFIDLRDENEIMERFGEEIYNSLTKSMVSAMQANQAEVDVQPA